VATYTVGKSTNIIICTETQSQRMKNKRLTAKAGDLKFGTVLGFAKCNEKIAPKD